MTKDWVGIAEARLDALHVKNAETGRLRAELYDTTRELRQCRDALAEERERCCIAVCSHCADGVPVRLIDGQWYHPIDRQSHSDDGFVECDAQAIRERGDE